MRCSAEGFKQKKRAILRGDSPPACARAPARPGRLRWTRVPSLPEVARIAVRLWEGFVAAVGLEEKYDAVRQLIAVGKERGYLLYDEVNDSLPAEVHSSEEIDDLLTTFERNGIEIYEDQASAKAARALEVSSDAGDQEAVVKDEAHSDEGGSDLDLTPGSLEKTDDPVRMYLREMGTVPLLTREGEVTIAKRIERGQLVVMKSITRSPIVIKELIAVGDDLRKGVRSI